MRFFFLYDLRDLCSSPTKTKKINKSHVSRGHPNRGTRPSYLLFAIIALCLVTQWMPMSSRAETHSLILATTTSVRDSGLLDALLPDFERKTGIEVRVIAVGTGAALRMGREGDADVLLTHAPSAEAELVREGVVTRRTPFMENFFVLAGPAEDPAKIADAATPVEAIRQIAKMKSRWISRGDDSGTHKREKSLFEAAHLDPDEKWQGLERTGTGMGLSLQVAGELRAYILSDLGTFLAFIDRIDLVAFSTPSDSLRNTYSILQLDPTRFERPIATEAALELERYFLGPTTQLRIGEHGKKRFGRSLFTALFAKPKPNSMPHRERRN